MTRRVVRGRSRVLLSDSSDEEEEANIDVKHVVAEDNVATSSVLDVESMLLEDEIEDDEIFDEPPPVTIFPVAAEPARNIPQMNNFQQGGSPLLQLLRRRGINVHTEWLESFVREMEGSHPGFSTFGVDKQGELALAHLLITDFNEVGAGCLPNSFQSLHATELAGPFVLQVTIPFLMMVDICKFL